MARSQSSNPLFQSLSTFARYCPHLKNQLLFKLLSNSTDKVTRVSAINKYEEGGLKMTDLNCMIKLYTTGMDKTYI